MKTANLKSHTTLEMSWNIYFQAFTVRTWRKRLSNLNTFLTPHIYWGIHITICVNYNQHNRSAAQKNPVNKICLLLVFSVPTERAAIATGNDLRGLGICHQQALAGIPETGFLLNTQSYVRLHCLPILSRIRDKICYTESQIIPNTSKKACNRGIS